MLSLLALAFFIAMLGLVIYLWVKNGADLFPHHSGDDFIPSGVIPEFVMRSATYVNRYGDNIYFVQISPNEIQMTNGKWVRIGFRDEKHYADKKYLMVDPSGGPYIAEGSDLGYIHEGWSGYIVDHITSREPDVYIIVCKIPE